MEITENDERPPEHCPKCLQYKHDGPCERLWLEADQTWYEPYYD